MCTWTLSLGLQVGPCTPKLQAQVCRRAQAFTHVAEMYFLIAWMLCCCAASCERAAVRNCEHVSRLRNCAVIITRTFCGAKLLIGVDVFVRRASNRRATDFIIIPLTFVIVVHLRWAPCLSVAAWYRSSMLHMLARLLLLVVSARSNVQRFSTMKNIDKL